MFQRPLPLLALAAVLPSCGPVIVADKATNLAAMREQITFEHTPGRTLSYLRSGDDTLPRLIYIHGTPGDATEWASYLTDPVPGFETIAIDRLGFGQSTTTLEDADGFNPGTRKPIKRAIVAFEEQAASIAPLLIERHGKRPIILGHSLGGPIAARLAAMYPDRVGGLVILAGSLDPALEELKWYNHLADWAPVSWLLDPALRISNHEILAAKEQTTLLAPVLSNITCPVVVIQGMLDELVPKDNADYIERTFVNAASMRVIRLPKAGHFLPWEHEPEVRAAIQAVAESPRQPTPTR